MISNLRCDKFNFENEYYILAFITNRCNYKCWYCYNKNEVFKDLNLDDLYVYIKKIQNCTRRRIILNFIGGEPTCHKKLLQFCTNIYDNNISIEIITNFSNNVDFFKKFPDNVKFTVSFHAQWADVNDFVFKCIELKQMIQNIIVMFDKKNSFKSLNCYDMLVEKGFFNMVELNLIDDLKYSQHEKNEFMRRRSNSMSYISDNFNLQFNDIASFNRQSFKNWKCNAGIDTQYIHSDGKVYYCESYYSENKLPYTSIYAKDFKFINHPIICNCGNCAGNYFIKKQKHLTN